QQAQLFEQTQAELTRRKIAQAALQWEETLLRLVANTTPLAFYVVNNKTEEILFFNRYFCQLWHLEHLEPKIRNGTLKNRAIIAECLKLLDREALSTYGRRVQSLLNPDIYEDEIPLTDGRTFRRLFGEIRSNEGIYQGHLYAFEDITDRKANETALRDRQQQLVTIGANIPGVIFRLVLDTDGKISLPYISPGLQELIGLASEVASQNPEALLELVHLEDQTSFQTHLAASLKTLQDFSLEYRIITLSGESKWIQGRARFVESENHGLIVDGIILDINDRKQAESALQASEQRFASLVDAAPVGIFRTNLEGKYLYVSDRFCTIAGLSISLAYCDWSLGLHPEDRSRIVVLWEQAVSQVAPFAAEYRFQREDGRVVWVYGQAVPEINEYGQPIGYIGTLTDISARKQAEATLRDREALLRAIFERSAIGITINDLSGKFVRANPAYQEMVGYSEEVLQTMNLLDLTDKEYSAQNFDSFQALIQNHQEFFQIEERYRCRGGKRIWVRVTASLLPDESGQPQLVMAIVENINERKQAQLALQRLNQQLESRVQQRTRELELSQASLRQREQEFRTLVENSPDLIHRLDRAYRYLYINPEAERRGILVSSLIGKTIRESGFPADQVLLWQQATQRVFDTGQEEAIESSLHLSGGELYYHTRIVPEFATDGSIPSVLAVARDITALKQSEARFRTLINNIPGAVYRSRDTAVGWSVPFISPGIERMVGYRAIDFMENRVWFEQIIHPEDRPGALQQMAEAIANHQPFSFEYRLIHADGSLRWVMNRGQAIFNETGQFLYLDGVLFDITDRKQAETALWQQVEQEQLMAAIAQRIRESLDLNEILQTTVAEVQQLLGVDRVLVFRVLPDGTGCAIAEAVALGWVKVLDQVFPEEVFPRQCYQQYIEGRINAIPDVEQAEDVPCLVNFLQQLKVKAKVVVPIVQQETLWGLIILHQCSQTREWQAWEIELLRKLAIQLAIAIQQSEIYKQLRVELLERIQVEETLQLSLFEKEILLKEIHHRVKNNLCVVASLLELQSDTIADPQISRMLEESQHRIYSMALIHEKLYRSQNLARINFGEYLEDLVRNLFDSYSLSHHFIELEFDYEEIFLNVETATPCGLIITELVSNALKHAFPNDRSGIIRVECHHTKEHKIRLAIRDNGIGFPETLDFQNTNSMGFQVICTLTKQLKGILEIDRNNGTAFYLIFSQLKYRKRF
ncbi:MAG: PAS domain S-box protein, partial [Actinomycetota bacterium]